ncbi:hypothetical protein C8R44DRAFT_751095 [Mycena epipterygia]|nr:hypothetical protein C8R44DRAFT_751095 [Mycena epipterygia]
MKSAASFREEDQFNSGVDHGVTPPRPAGELISHVALCSGSTLFANNRCQRDELDLGDWREMKLIVVIFGRSCSQVVATGSLEIICIPTKPALRSPVGDSRNPERSEGEYLVDNIRKTNRGFNLNHGRNPYEDAAAPGGELTSRAPASLVVFLSKVVAWLGLDWVTNIRAPPTH